MLASLSPPPPANPRPPPPRLTPPPGAQALRAPCARPRASSRRAPCAPRAAADAAPPAKKVDRWAGLGTDTSDDQQDLTRGKARPDGR